MEGGVGIGDQLSSYRIVAVIGRGGMSVVYLAEDVRLGRKVTLKVLPPELSSDTSFRDRFVRESRIAAALDHPHIVPIYEADEANGRLFIAMRYVRGTDLDALIKSEGPLPIGRIVSIISQVASALDTAHAEGLVHRDVKPANILVAPGAGPASADHAYLSDFGITKRLSYATAEGSGEIMGTVDYVAPEQIEGAAIDGRADVYSLGCVMYQCLAGEVPFPRNSELAVLWAHTREKPPRVTSKRPEMSAQLDRLVAHAMAKRPSDRYQRCSDLASEAQRVAGEAIREPPSGRGHRKRRWLIAVGVAAVLLASGALCFLGGSGPTPSRGTVKLRRILAGTLADDAWLAPDSAEGMADGDGGVWVITPSQVVFIPPGAPDDVRHIPLQFRPADIDVGLSAVWVVGTDPETGDGKLARIDPGSGLARIVPLDDPAQRVVVGLGSVWVLTTRGSTSSITRFDPKTTTERNEFPLDTEAVDLAAGAHGVWFVDGPGGTLGQLDLQHGGVVPPIPVSEAATGVGAGRGRVWLIDGPHRLV